MKWYFAGDISDVKGSSLCKSGFDDGFRVGGVLFEVKNAGPIKILYSLFGDSEESGAENLFSAELLHFV